MRKELLVPGAAALLLLVAFFLLSVLFLAQPTAWQIEDDEGVYLYQAWRISLGEWPYRDFLSAQQPLFIGLGGLVMALTGPSQATLRLLSCLTMLGAATVLGASVGRTLKRPEAGAAAALIFLSHPDLFHAGRLYLSESYMLLGCTLGLAALTRWQESQRCRYLLVAGTFFALATLCKLFAAFLWAGASLFVVWSHLLRSSSRRPGLAVSLFALLGPALGMAGVMGLLEGLTGAYVAATVGHHLRAGAGATLMASLVEKLTLFRDYAVAYPLLVCLGLSAGIYALLRRRAKWAWLTWQLPPALGFLLVRRELGMRHCLAFLPALAGLGAAALTLPWRSKARIVGSLLTLALVIPWLPANLGLVRRVEHQTADLVAALQEQTTPDTVILADYLELNFLSQRRTVPIAAGLHHASAASGQITATALIEQLGDTDKPWVIVDVSPLTGSTLVGLQDYPIFHVYLREHFRLAGTFYRDVQHLQVWEPLHQPPPTLQLPPPEHPLDVQIDDLALLTGYTLDGIAAPGQPLTLTLFWEALSTADTAYSVFVHFQAPDGTLVTNWDGEPLEGLYPTWRWRSGQLIPDRRTLPLPSNLEPGAYRLSIGIYDWRTGQRLPAWIPGNGVVLDEARIVLTDVIVPPDEH